MAMSDKFALRTRIVAFGQGGGLATTYHPHPCHLCHPPAPNEGGPARNALHSNADGLAGPWFKFILSLVAAMLHCVYSYPFVVESLQFGADSFTPEAGRPVL